MEHKTELEQIVIEVNENETNLRSDTEFAKLIIAAVFKRVRTAIVERQGSSGNQGLRMGYALAIDDLDSELALLGIKLEEG